MTVTTDRPQIKCAICNQLHSNGLGYPCNQCEAKRLRRDDGNGCVERIHPAEHAWNERYGCR